MDPSFEVASSLTPSVEEEARLRQHLEQLQLDAINKASSDDSCKVTYQNPSNLIPTQTRAEMSGSQINRLTNDMRLNGYDETQPVDVWANPDTGRLEIQDGHHRAAAARNAGIDSIPVRIWK